LRNQKKKGRMLRSSLLVGTMTMTSRVLGLIRDMVIATYFGSSASADAFFVAFRIPNLFRRLFAEGAFSQAFVPVLAEYKTNSTKEKVKDLVDHVAGTLSIILLIFTALGIVTAPLTIYLFAPGFYQDPAKLQLAGHMLQITFPYLLLISLTAFAASVMNTYGKFAVASFTPVLLNISLISAAIFLTPYFNPTALALAWGVAIAGFVQLLLQFPFLARLHLLPKPKWGWHHPGVRKTLKLMTPALFGVSVSQISLLLDSILASFLQTGSVSWLYYSDRLAELPLGVFGVAIGSVILPSLSQQYAKKENDSFSKTMDWAIRLILLIAVPATIALIILAEPLLTTVFHHGEMTDRDVLMASGSLRAFALGLTAFMMIKVLAPGYFSRQDTKAPVKIAVKALAANMVLNLILIWPLAHVGLALATSLSSSLNAWLLYRGLRKSHIYLPQAGWWRFVLQLAIASGMMAVVLIVFNVPTSNWLAWPAHKQIIHLGILVISGLVTYFISLIVMGLRFRHLQH